MPGKKKKKFIDKKNAVTFRLVHRSQKDPLQADDDAPQRVLVTTSEVEKQESRQEEQKKFGVFFEDDYDYMQHLKDVKELYEVEPDDHFRITREVPTPVLPDVSFRETHPEPGLQLPSTVFGSTVETEVGLLNKAAPLRGPQLDWDPDIVAALDDDFNFDDPENQLEDDFIAQANEGKPEGDSCSEDDTEDEGEIASDEAENLSDVGSDLGSFGDQSFDDIETKTRFTSYSMSSSVIRRNEGLSLLDSRFEKIYEQYDDEEIGALDQDDIMGYVNQGSELLNAAMSEYEKQQREKEIKLKDGIQPASEEVDLDSGSSDSGNEEDLVRMTLEEPKEKWDCESILSTYSTLYNHPKTIEEPKKTKPIKLTKRAGIPTNVLSERGLTRRQLEELNASNQEERLQPVTYRPPDETTEEKKARKKAIKDERKARREEKKANKIAFKAEKIRQDKEVINVQKNLQGIKID